MPMDKVFCQPGCLEYTRVPSARALGLGFSRRWKSKSLPIIRSGSTQRRKALKLRGKYNEITLKKAGTGYLYRHVDTVSSTVEYTIEASTFIVAAMLNFCSTMVVFLYYHGNTIYQSNKNTIFSTFLLMLFNE